MELYEKSIGQLRKMLDDKQVTSVEITKSYLKRIKEVDEKINGFITVTEELALKQAEEADKRLAQGKKISDLDGIPMALKDNISTDGVLTTCASKMLYNYVPPYNATVAELLYNAGAILLGKTNLDEFAMGSTTENSYFKKTKNPWNLNCVPGGSSGGSAAVVASNEAAFALGSDTGGSIRQPAHFCGVVGMKPTYGSVSRYGLIAFASSLDQIGPLTKNVEDMAMVLNTIIEYDKKDSTSYKVEKIDYKEALDKDVKGVKVAIPNDFFGEGIDKEIKDKVRNVANILKNNGAIVENVDMPFSIHALPVYYIIASAEASSNLARFDGVRFGYRTENYTNLDELYKNTRSEGFGEEVKRRIMLGTYVLSSGYYDAYYKKGQQVRTLIKQEYDKLFEEYDIVLTPTGPTTAFEFGKNVDNPIQMYMNDICTVPVNIAGLPALSLNCGFDNRNMPIGVQLIGKHFDEFNILKVASFVEKELDIEKKAEV